MTAQIDIATASAQLLNVSAFARPGHLAEARCVAGQAAFYSLLLDMEDRMDRCSRTVRELARARRSDKIQHRVAMQKMVDSYLPIVTELRRVRTSLNTLRGIRVAA